MRKTTFEKKEPKKYTYCNYKQFQWENFEKDLTSSLRNCNGEYENYEQNFIKVLNTHAPKKVKILKGNHKPHYKKNLRKAIMKRSRLKNKANRSKDPVDIDNYKKATQLRFQIPKAQDLFRKPENRTFPTNMLAEILRLGSLKMIKCY